jgi:hypothetical protein
MLRASIAALTIHAALLIGASRVAPRPGTPLLHKALTPRASLELEVDVATPEATGAPAAAATAGGPEPARDGRRLALVSKLPEGHGMVPSLETSEPGEGADTSAPGGAPEAPSEAPTRSGPQRPLEALGIGESTALLPRADSKKMDPARAAARGGERALAPGGAEHDRHIGMGSGGPVLSALERAAYGSGLPGNTSALFLARIDEKGTVTFLDVLDVNADHGSWSGIATRALGTLRGKKLRISAGSRGVELRIRVSSREVLPSGADPGLEVRALGIPVKKGRGKRSARISILEPMARLDWVDVTLPDGQNARLPMLNVGIGVLGLAGDPSDIGAKPRRVVHARVESETPL